MKTYTRGDAAAYRAWLERQDGPLWRLAARYRPWEIYQLQGRDILVRIVGYEALQGAELLQVQYLDPMFEGRIIGASPEQLELWGVLGLDDVPSAKAA